MFFKVGVLNSFANLPGISTPFYTSTPFNFTPTPVLESLINEVAGLKAWNFIKKRFQHVFSFEICKIFKNTFLQNTSGGYFDMLFFFFYL